MAVEMARMAVERREEILKKMEEVLVRGEEIPKEEWEFACGEMLRVMREGMEVLKRKMVFVEKMDDVVVEVGGGDVVVRAPEDRKVRIAYWKGEERVEVDGRRLALESVDVLDGEEFSVMALCVDADGKVGYSERVRARKPFLEGLMKPSKWRDVVVQGCGPCTADAFGDFVFRDSFECEVTADEKPEKVRQVLLKADEKTIALGVGSGTTAIKVERTSKGWKMCAGGTSVELEEDKLAKIGVRNQGHRKMTLKLTKLENEHRYPSE